MVRRLLPERIRLEPLDQRVENPIFLEDEEGVVIPTIFAQERKPTFARRRRQGIGRAAERLIPNFELLRDRLEDPAEGDAVVDHEGSRRRAVERAELHAPHAPSRKRRPPRSHNTNDSPSAS